MAPRATFYPKPETNFTGFNTVDLRLCPTYKMDLQKGVFIKVVIRIMTDPIISVNDILLVM